jgi:hypothetical protein
MGPTTLLRLMGACFVLAGAGVLLFMEPLMRIMGGAWVGVGVVLLVIAQFVASAAAHKQRLLHTGKPGRATILEVVDTGVTVNRNPRVRLHVRIEVDGEPAVEGTHAVTVSRLEVPRTGEVYDVRFDPQNPNDFVFAASSAGRRAAIAAPTAAPVAAADDTLGQLERLAALRDDGALTPEEFEAQKRKLLGSS